MEQFQNIIKKHFYISLIFFALGLFFGFIYSVNLLGYIVDSSVLDPQNMRSLHISLMLYGFVPLMLSYLPFLLIAKDIGYHHKAIRNLELYTYFWYIFLVVMIISILLGVRRELAFYDFHYSLNMILAFAGLFYILGLVQYIRQYKVIPLWIKVSLAASFIAPFGLLILMNPVIGQVEKTITGPHGDNTLGMSLSLIPIYYLIIKYLSDDDFKAKWNILWIIPTIFYAISVLYRSFIGELTYNEEWFYQWLTFLYVPLLYRWYKDANIEKNSKHLLFVSIVAFLFVDIQGNILFIDSIRWVFHRNDLIVAHAHVAMGIGVMFMTLSLYGKNIVALQKRHFTNLFLFGMLGMFTVLSISGFVQSNFIDLNIESLWKMRSFFALLIIASLLYFYKINLNLKKLQTYNLIGVINDGLSGIFLFLLADFLYPTIGIRFDGIYEYVVFGFVSTTGLIHYLALRFDLHQEILTQLSVMMRYLIGSIFLALFLSTKLGYEALFISVFDYSYASVYLIFFYNTKEVSHLSA